jgi:SAM-dependent methyltransferase
MIKKLSNIEESEERKWYNIYLEKNYNGFSGRVLDIGKSAHWDYSGIFGDYKTIDVIPELKPDILANISDFYDIGHYDLILCNGVYEQMVGDFNKLVKAVHRLLRMGGITIFGLIGKEYLQYGGRDSGNRVKREEIDDILKKFTIIRRKYFDDRYYYLICQKTE